jgi:hypothetical protein
MNSFKKCFNYFPYLQCFLSEETLNPLIKHKLIDQTIITRKLIIDNFELVTLISSDINHPDIIYSILKRDKIIILIFHFLNFIFLITKLKLFLKTSFNIKTIIHLLNILIL